VFTVGLRSKEIEGKSFSEMSELLSTRLESLKLEIINYKDAEWKASFIRKCEVLYEELLSVWDDDWIKHASGKRLIDDLYKEFSINIPKLTLKRKLVKRMKIEKNEDWTLVKSKIIDALSN
jgi:hypothetical protein